MKAYTICDKDNVFEGINVITTSSSKAKSIATTTEEMVDSEYINLRVSVCKNADIDGLVEGIYTDYEDALRRKFFDVLLNWRCPTCNKDETSVYYKDGFYCDNCETKPTRTV